MLGLTKAQLKNLGGMTRSAGVSSVPGSAAAAAPAAATAAQASPQASSAASGPAPDATYSALLAALQKGRDSTVAGLEGQRRDTLSNYGYQEPDGTVASLSIDPSNPFSRSGLLTRSYQQNRAGTDTSFGAQGQYNSGARLNAQNSNQFNWEQGKDALKKTVAGILGNIVGSETAARTGYDTNAAGAYGDLVARATNADTGSAATGTPGTVTPTPITPAIRSAGGAAAAPARGSLSNDLPRKTAKTKLARKLKF